MTGLNKEKKQDSEKVKIEKKPLENKIKDRPKVKRSMEYEKEYKSDQFVDAEITTDCDDKAGICIIQKCVNGGECTKFTQYRNGTRF